MRKKGNELSLMLLQESLWGIEDKINVIVETLADHEAEIIRLKRHNQLHSERLNTLEVNRIKPTDETYDRQKPRNKS